MELLLRDHQVPAIDMAREAMRRSGSVMFYAPTGFGKTEVAIWLMNAARNKGRRTAMILDRIVLCNQTSKRLSKYAIRHSVLQAGSHLWKPNEHIQICSVQTLEKREEFPNIDLLIVDEAHIHRASVTEFIKTHPDVKVIGLSATPFTRGLANHYGEVVCAATTKQLVESKWLVPLRVFVAKQIDMNGAKKIAGEWSEKEATARGIKITGDIVAEWVKKTHEIYGGPKKTIVFCAGVAHGEHLANAFAQAGYNFVSISYKDDDEYKEAVISDFSRPDTEIHGLIATDILTKGFDVADVCIGISARPFSKSLSSHIQQMGRVMRPYEGKEAATWLCHSGNYLRFRQEWDAIYANGVDALDNAEEKPKPEPTEQEKEEARCPSCGSLWAGLVDICPYCGHVRQKRNDVVQVAGELLELNGNATRDKYTNEEKRRWHAELLGYAKSRNYDKWQGWAYYRYKEKFGVGPYGSRPEASPTISLEVQNWIRHRNIAAAKRREKLEARA